MTRDEIIRRLKKIARHAVHFVGEKPFVMSLDDGIAVSEVLELLKEQETKLVEIDGQLGGIKYGRCPKCGKGLNEEAYPRWCGFCGQELKWE